MRRYFGRKRDNPGSNPIKDIFLLFYRALYLHFRFCFILLYFFSIYDVIFSDILFNDL